MLNNYRYILSIFMMLIFGCSENPVPKPRGFQRIDLPERAYSIFHSGCSFSAEIPKYAIGVRDSATYAEPCWFNIEYLPFNATLHLSYKPIQGRATLNQMIEDSRTLVYKHTIKADDIYETLISNNKLNGMLYDLSGNTATNFQFYVTDSTHHFLRGSLYFNEKTNPDSVAPVLRYIERDIIHMLETLSWD